MPVSFQQWLLQRVAHIHRAPGADFLGPWVAHAAGVAREEVQVWAAEDERERLGAGGDGGGGVLGAPVVRGGTGHLPPPPPLLPGTPLEAWRHGFVSFPSLILSTKLLSYVTETRKTAMHTAERRDRRLVAYRPSRGSPVEL